VKVFRCGPRRDGGGWACVGPRWKTSQGGSRGGWVRPMGKACGWRWPAGTTAAIGLAQQRPM